MADKSRSRRAGRRGSGNDRQSVFAGLLMSFGAAVERFRNRGREVDYTETTLFWDDEDGGLASARVPRRPTDLSGSGSAALVEPIADDPARDIPQR
jgi:hypothetical protein